MKGKKKTLFAVALLLLVGLTSGYVASTYAKYADKIDDVSGNAKVAKWAFTDDNKDAELTIALKPDPDNSTLSENTIAPGTSGSFNIVLSNATTETGVDFTVQLKAIEGTPKHLKFYKDEDHTIEVTPGTGTITGQLIAKATETLSVPIYWNWEYGTSPDVDDQINIDDTADGKLGKTLSVGVSITGIQTAPSENAITSHVD